MRGLMFSQIKKKRLLLIVVFAMISAGFSLSVAWQPAAAQGKLSLADVLTGLKSQKVTLAQRNKLLADAVWNRGVTFALTPEIEKELTRAGANSTLLDAIRQNGPRVVTTVTPTKTPTTNTTGVYNADYYHKRGDEFFDKDLFAEAVTEYDKALQLNPNLGLAYVRRGFSHNYLGNIPQAANDYASALRVDPNLKNEAYIKCVYYRTGDDPYNVIDYCNETIRKFKSFSLAYFKRGMAYLDTKDYDATIRDYTEAIRLYPKFGYAYNSRAVVLINSRKDYSGAVSDASNAIRYLPNFDSAYYNRGLAYYYLKNYNASLADFNQLLRLKPNDVDGFYYRGLIFYDTQDYNQAITNFSRVLNLDPKDVGSYRFRGICYYNLKNYQAAISDYTEAIRLDPSPNAYKNRALAYDAIGRSDLAAADRRRAQQLEQ